MGSPVLLAPINFTVEDLKPGSSSWLANSKRVRCALEEYGCFVGQYDQLSTQLRDQIFGQAKDLFELPVEVKMKNTREDQLRGYVGPTPRFPLFESLAICNDVTPQETQKFKNLMWPDGKKNLCETLDLFTQILKDLKHAVLQMVFESFGAGKHYESVDSANSDLIRFNTYGIPAEEITNATVIYQSHTDLNFSTILVQNDFGCLEIQTKEGDWISFESGPSQFIFMAGEGLKVWSNDRVRACMHRVKHLQDKERYSIIMFTENKGVIQVPEELVDDNHPLLYNPFDSVGFVSFSHGMDKANHVESATKAYCGVVKS